MQRHSGNRNYVFLKKYVYFGMRSGSEVQRWLVAIQCHYGNWNMIFSKKLRMFWYAFEIWNSTAACCDSRSIWKSKWYFPLKICIFPVCLRDLKFNGALLRLRVNLKIEIQFLRKLPVFRYGFKIWNSTVACCDLRAIRKLKSDFFKNYVLFGVLSRSEIQRWLVAI